MNSLKPSLKDIYAILLILLFSSCGDEDATIQQNAPEVDVVAVIKKDVPIFQEFVGQVSGLYDIPIRARVDGFLEGRFFEEGSEVKKGQLLYVIDSQSYMAEVASKKSDVASAQSILVNAQNELKRIEPLAKKNAVSKSDLDAAVADKGAAEASLEAAMANLQLAEINLDYTKIKSPINGVIGKTKAKRGEYVGKDPNPVILNTVSRIDTILVQFFITESNYLKLSRAFVEANRGNTGDKKRQVSNVRLILADGGEHSEVGKIDFVDREVDPTTGSMLVQASFPNPDGIIRPGQFAKVRVQIKTEEAGRLIPLRSVVMIQGKYNVYVLSEDGKVQLKEFQPYHFYGDLVLVKSGIEHGEKIVVEGLQRIRSGMSVSPEDVTFESKSDNPF